MRGGNVSLVLGSGGARGIAHIGVIEELEKEGFTIRQVVGCSMGAVVGGIYCAGYLQEYKHWLTTLTKLDVFNLLDFTLSAQGFVKGEKVFKTMESLMGDHRIEDFSIPFTAVAVDINNKREVHYQSGSLFKALRASIAIPTIFTPVVENGSQLVDGGVLNPLPIDLVSPKSDHLVVAVNLNAGGEKEAEPVNPENVANKLSKNGKNGGKLGLFDLLNKSFDLTQDRLIELTIALHKPDILVNIPRDACGVFEFYRALEMIELGRKAFHQALEERADGPLQERPSANGRMQSPL